MRTESSVWSNSLSPRAALCTSRRSSIHDLMSVIVASRCLRPALTGKPWPQLQCLVASDAPHLEVVSGLLRVRRLRVRDDGVSDPSKSVRCPTPVLFTERLHHVAPRQSSSGHPLGVLIKVSENHAHRAERRTPLVGSPDFFGQVDVLVCHFVPPFSPMRSTI